MLRTRDVKKVITCKIFSAVLSKLTTTYKCVDCKCPLLLDKGFATCANCSPVMIEKNILILLELLQSITKRSIQNKMAFVSN